MKSLEERIEEWRLLKATAKEASDTLYDYWTTQFTQEEREQIVAKWVLI